MHRLAYIAATCLAGAAISAPSAFAVSLPTDRPATTTRTAESLRIAREFWGQPAPGLRVYLATSDELEAVSGISGTAAYATPRGIWLDDWMMGPRTYDVRISACNAIVHDYGHVINAKIGSPNPVDPIHSLAANSVMRQLQPEWKIVYGCYKRFMPKGKARQWRDSLGHRPVWLTR